MNISPWTESFELPSPDGKLVASIEDAWEIGMGGPMVSTLSLSNGLTIKGCNPSIVWSSDSQYLVVPQWESNSQQKLLLVEPAAHRTTVMPGTYGVLLLESFENSVINCIDLSYRIPKKLKLDITKYIPMEHARFVQLRNERKLKTRFDYSREKQVNSEKMLPKRYHAVQIFCALIWILSVLSVFAVMYFHTWWAGLLLLVLSSLPISIFTRIYTAWFIIDYSVENPEFYQFVVSEGVICAWQKP
jgi:hypothetical protein